MTVATNLSATIPLDWGDQGNGTYRNPVINADYSDPDVIRVGEKYYMVASDFHFMGMQILESHDMVNWRIVTQVYNRFDMPKWDTNERYAGGSWAPALRYHDGKYWIFFCTPHEGLFMTQAERPEGPWSPLHCLKAVEKWEDPCPFWDSDGRAYLGRSQHGAGPIILHRMSADGRTLLDDGVTIYTGPVAEGTKFLKRGEWYYLSIPEGGVGEGWQTVLRSKNIYGPYERKVVLEQGTTTINGPHQGALVDTPQGTWWFYHFQETEALGRVVHLQPVEWKDGWPMIGTDIDGNGIGEPVMQWKKPLSLCKASLPQTSDDFSGGQLSPQWQWNHNPANEAWSLTENPGALTLHALQSDSFIKARNTLTQKCMGYDSEATVKIDFAHLAAIPLPFYLQAEGRYTTHRARHHDMLSQRHDKAMAAHTLRRHSQAVHLLIQHRRRDIPPGSQSLLHHPRQLERHSPRTIPLQHPCGRGVCKHWKCKIQYHKIRKNDE